MENGLSALLGALSPGTAAGLLIITALLSYLLGCCNGAILVSKFLLGDDVREHGSGNGGLTNFQRTYGGSRFTLLVIGVDVVKMLLSVWISRGLFALVLPDAVPLFVTYWAGCFCIVGHVFPCALHFHGGKGILCGGVFTMLVDWRVGLVAWGLFLLAVVITRWVSLGSVLAASSVAVTTILFYPLPSLILPGVLAAVLLDWKHRGNIQRLIHGEEPKLSLRRKKAEP